MSEFDRRSALRKPEITPPRDEEFDDSVFDQAAADASPAAGREGLPPTFRMRHDEHYVDQITSRTVAPPVQLVAITDIDAAQPLGRRDLGALVESIRAYGVVQPLLVRRRNGRFELIAGSMRLAAAMAAGLTEVPCLLQQVDDERARALADAENLRCQSDDVPGGAMTERAGLPATAASEIIDSLATIESCLNLFLGRERPLRERVSVELMRAEAHRARWLAQAYVLLAGEPHMVKKPVSPSSLVDRTLQGLAAEGRLANVDLSLAIDEPACTLHADERLVSVALTGVVGAMLFLVQAAGGATVKLRVNTHPVTRLLAFQVSQDLVPMPETRLAANGIARPPEWPGGHAASVGLAVAHRVAELHGGQVETSPGPRSGCTIRLVLPAGD